MLPSVQVFLSTFNGEVYLDEQLQSLTDQAGVRVQVLCRDDGSSDSTPAILDKWSKKNDEKFSLTILEQGALGVAASFFSLMKSSLAGHPFYAFCDQDDVWQKQKLNRAIELLESINGPGLYFSPVQKVTEDLKPIQVSTRPKKLDFSSALVEGLATGCTVVFNRELLELFKRNPPEKHVLMHDWWMHLLAHGCGQVVCDTESYVLYRQHASNVVGAQSSFASKYWMKIKRFVGRGVNAAHLTDQAREFYRCYEHEMEAEHRNVLRAFLESKKSFWTRLKWALTLPTPRQTHLDSFIFRILILLNRY